MRGGVIWMARARNPNRDKSKQIWIKSKGSKKLKDIAEELGCSASQIRKWKSQDKWEDELKGNAPNGNSNVTNEKERYQSAKGNQNAKGNPGNKRAKPPPNNKNAVTHGLFAKWIPEEKRMLMQELYESSPADILWNNITIQYSTIVQSQLIMNVANERDDISNITRIDIDPMKIDKNGDPVRVSEQREWHMAYQRQEKLLSAQSRAMGTLSNLIKQFLSLADEDDKRKLELESMRARIKLMDIKAQEGGMDDEIEDDGFLDALDSEGEELWPEE